jgi:predicted DNA-binding WGR domain protein
MSKPEQLDLLDWLAAQPPCPPPDTPAVEAVSPATSATSVHLTRVDPSCNMSRFYSLALATSLFGECGVVRQWGRIGTSGQSRTEWYEARDRAAAELERMAARKRRRGYSS